MAKEIDPMDQTQWYLRGDIGIYSEDGRVCTFEEAPNAQNGQLLVSAPDLRNTLADIMRDGLTAEHAAKAQALLQNLHRRPAGVEA